MHNGSTPSGNGHSNRWNSMNPVNGQSQPSGEHGARDDEITLQELVGMLWGGKWVILATFAVVLALGAAYTFSQTPIYETSSLVLVEKQGGASPRF